MAKKDKGEKKGRNRGRFATLKLMIISLMLITVFHTGFVFFVVAMLPSIVAYYMDITSARTTYQTVMTCNLSGVIPFMAEMLKNPSQSGSYTTDLMSDAWTWLVVYGSAGFGWLLVYATPLFAQLLIASLHQGQIARFEHMQDRIEKEWGPEVASILKPQTDEEATPS